MWLYIIIGIVIIIIIGCLYYKFIYSRKEIAELIDQVDLNTDVNTEYIYGKLDDHKTDTDLNIVNRNHQQQIFDKKNITNKNNKKNNEDKIDVSVDDNSKNIQDEKIENIKQSVNDDILTSEMIYSDTGVTDYEHSDIVLDDKHKKVYIHAAYKNGFIAGTLTNNMNFCKNAKDGNIWSIDIIEQNPSIITCSIYDNDKYFGVVDSKLELVSGNDKMIFELIFDKEAESRNVFHVKLHNHDKYIQLSENGTVIVVDKLNYDNFMFKVTNADN